MSIQPPPLLCQPWTGLIFSGSFLPLFSWPPPHLFQADLAVRQQINLEQSNIAQRVHTLQPLTNENAKFGSILYNTLSGNIPAIFDTPGTLMLHSKYVRRAFYVFQLHFV